MITCCIRLKSTLVRADLKWKILLCTDVESVQICREILRYGYTNKTGDPGAVQI